MGLGGLEGGDGEELLLNLFAAFLHKCAQSDALHEYATKQH